MANLFAIAPNVSIDRYPDAANGQGFATHLMVWNENGESVPPSTMYMQVYISYREHNTNAEYTNIYTETNATFYSMRDYPTCYEKTITKSGNFLDLNKSYDFKINVEYLTESSMLETMITIAQYPLDFATASDRTVFVGINSRANTNDINHRITMTGGVNIIGDVKLDNGGDISMEEGDILCKSVHGRNLYGDNYVSGKTLEARGEDGSMTGDIWGGSIHGTSLTARNNGAISGGSLNVGSGKVSCGTLDCSSFNPSSISCNDVYVGSLNRRIYVDDYGRLRLFNTMAGERTIGHTSLRGYNVPVPAKGNKSKTVYVDAGGFLGVDTSTRRVKHDIVSLESLLTNNSASDMCRFKIAASDQERKPAMNPDDLLTLTVSQYKINEGTFDDKTFDYNTEFVGLIAEEVAEKCQPAACYDNEGNVDGWEDRPILLGMLMLVQRQDKKIKDLEARIDVLEKNLGGQNESNSK